MRKKWTAKEKKAFAEKMKKAREGKKFVRAEQEPVADVQESIQPAILHPLAEIVRKYFSEVEVQIISQEGGNHIVSFELSDGKRMFVVHRGTDTIETENWCKKIKANIQGRSASKIAGVDLLTGGIMKKPLPPEVGQDKEFFFRE